MYDSLFKFGTCASLDLIAAGILKSKFRSPGQFCVLGLIPVWFLWILSCFIQFCARGNVYPFVSISFRAMALNSLQKHINKRHGKYQLRQNDMIELRFSCILKIYIFTRLTICPRTLTSPCTLLQILLAVRLILNYLPMMEYSSLLHLIIDLLYWRRATDSCHLGPSSKWMKR